MMLPLYSFEIAALREAQEATMTTTCVRVRDIYEDDGRGGRRKTGEDRVTMKCRIMSIKTHSETIFLKEERLRAEYIVTVPWGSDVQRGDRFEFGDRVFGVTSVPDIETFHGPSAIICFCEEL